MFTLSSAAASAATATAASVTTSRDDAETSGVKGWMDGRVVETRERLNAGSCQRRRLGGLLRRNGHGAAALGAEAAALSAWLRGLRCRSGCIQLLPINVRQPLTLIAWSARRRKRRSGSTAADGHGGDHGHGSGQDTAVTGTRQ